MKTTEIAEFFLQRKPRFIILFSLDFCCVLSGQIIHVNLCPSETTFSGRCKTSQNPARLGSLCKGQMEHLLF